MPIGGLKEKTLAALQYGAKTVIIPGQNKKDLEEVPTIVKNNIHFVLADSADTVLSHALSDKADAEHKKRIRRMVERKTGAQQAPSQQA